MNSVACVMLAALSVFDYPARQARHDELRGQFISAVADGDAEAMESTCREGVALLPEDPTWKYNLACSLSRAGKKAEALDALERAIRLGFRDTVAIGNDKDLRPLAGDRRFEDLLALAERLAGKPALFGPMSSIPADGQAGSTIIVGEQNLSWNLDAKCFIAKLAMDGADGPGNAGDIYLNRDGGHSVLKTDEFPGLTKVSLARECREHHIDMGMPNMLFPCPVFGNCSLAIVGGPMWRSMPRALMTTESGRLGLMQRLYLSNQVWVFPAVYDIAPVGTNGDVFASVAPFWISTQGRSWSDLYYLKAALEVSRSLKPDVKRRIVSQGLLAPTVQTILRKSLKGVASEDDYLTPKAHPTAFPQKGLDLARLKSMSAALTEDAVPPIAPLKGVAFIGNGGKPFPGEITYAGMFACAIVLRSPETTRDFAIVASGDDEYAFAAVHDERGAAKVVHTAPNAAKVTIDKTLMSPTNRVDVAVFARRQGSGWGAPSFVSFAVVDPSAPYSDPVLTHRDAAKQEKE